MIYGSTAHLHGLARGRRRERLRELDATLDTSSTQLTSLDCFGDIDATVTSHPILYKPVDNFKGFWLFASTSFTVSGKSHALDGGSAIAETGSLSSRLSHLFCS